MPIASLQRYNVKALNLKSRIRRLEKQIHLLVPNDTDNRLFRRLEAAEQRMAGYQPTQTEECRGGEKETA